MTFKRIFATAVGTAVLCIGLVSAQDVQFHSRLSTVPIDTANRAQITGHGNAAATLDGRRLRISGSFEGLQGPASAARLHLGAAIGVRGAAIHDLEVEHAAQGALNGSVELSARQVDALRAGQLYIQIDSAAAPEGNLWGWLLP